MCKGVGNETNELCKGTIKNELSNHNKWIRGKQNQFQGGRLKGCSWDMMLLTGEVTVTIRGNLMKIKDIQEF